MRAVTLRGFRVGSCRHPQRMAIRDGRWRPVDFPALAFLLVHPAEGPIVFDTGYDPAFFTATQPFPERLYRWTTPPTLGPRDALANQLVTVGVEPGDVRHLILSHFHADHMAGIHRFPNAAIHCARAGYSAMCAGSRLASVRKGMLRALIPPDFLNRAKWFEDALRVALPADLAPFNDGCDLLGDGSLLALPLPGHCPGHWGLVLREDTGLHMLVADAAWSSDAIRRDMPPPRLTMALLGDPVATRATLRGLHRLRARNPDIRLTPSHCPECAGEWA